jgi:hypothetical protein
MPRALTRARHDARQHFSEVSTRDRIRNKFRKVSLARDPANKNFGYDTPQKKFRENESARFGTSKILRNFGNPKKWDK